MSRALGALFIVLLWATAAFGQAAPAVHPGTKLNFPPTVGSARLGQSLVHTAGRETVYIYQYSAGKVQIVVSVFDGGRRVPAGSDNPIVTAQFTSEIEKAQQGSKAEGHANFERPAVPSSCTYGSVTFRCITYSASSPSGRLFAKVMLTGYRDSFVKLRTDWSQADRQTAADAEEALRSFVPALMR
jgi:hypothetical protein